MDYITSDMDMAAYLMTLGHKVKTSTNGGRHFYQFEHSDGLQTGIQNFLNDTPLNTFKLRTFCENLRRLRMELAISRKGGDRP